MFWACTSWVVACSVMTVLLRRLGTVRPGALAVLTIRQPPCRTLQIGFNPELRRFGPCGPRGRTFVMRVGVLGPLEVSAEGRQVDVAGPIPRRLLALLATHPGRFLSVDALIDGVWGDDPPAVPRQTLQSHVARLRHSLGEPGVIVVGPAGYRLAVNAADVDAFSFMAAAEDGHRELIRGDPAAAATALSAGLALWRGPAFAEFTACAALDAEAARLEQLRSR